MGHGHLSLFLQVFELVVAAPHVVQQPPVTAKTPDYLTALHSVDYTHPWRAEEGEGPFASGSRAEPDVSRQYNVSFPDLPGCLTCGNTIDDAKENAREALSAYLE